MKTKETPNPVTTAAEPASPTMDQVAALAQQIYEEEGRPEGRAEAHWLEAERRLGVGAAEKTAKSSSGGNTRRRR
jgi:hypothetical protein